MNCRLVMVPPPGEGCVAVESERSAAGDVFFRKGHMALDWLKSDSMVGARAAGESRCGVVAGVGKWNWGQETVCGNADGRVSKAHR